MAEPDELTWQPTPRSSNVDSAAYDTDTRTLYIRFRSGGMYAYQGCDEGHLYGLVESPSPGSYVARHLKDVYPAEKVE